MKTMIKVIAIATLAVILCVALVSCGVPSGKYTLGGDLAGNAYEFKGNKVTITTSVLGFKKEIKATYKVKGDKITFTFEDDKDAGDLKREATYEKTENGIKIDGFEYTKQK